MKKFIMASLILLFWSLNLNAFGHGDNTARGHSGSLGDFSSIAIHIPAKTEIIKSNNCSVDIQMSEKTATYIDVYKDRDTLVIKSRGSSWIRKSDDIKITISMPYWDSMKLTASGLIRSDEIWDLDSVLIRSTGSGAIELANIRADKLECSSSGSGNITVKEAYVKEDTYIHGSGSGDLYMDYLNTEQLNVKLSGSGKLRTEMISGEFEASLTGSGKATVMGHCSRAELQTSGSGGINGDELSADEAFIKITGSGDISLRDGAHLREIRMTGSGTFRSL